MQLPNLYSHETHEFAACIHVMHWHSIVCVNANTQARLKNCHEPNAFPPFSKGAGAFR